MLSVYLTLNNSGWASFILPVPLGSSMEVSKVKSLAKTVSEYQAGRVTEAVLLLEAAVVWPSAVVSGPYAFLQSLVALSCSASGHAVRSHTRSSCCTVACKHTHPWLRGPASCIALRCLSRCVNAASHCSSPVSPQKVFGSLLIALLASLSR